MVGLFSLQQVVEIWDILSGAAQNVKGGFSQEAQAIYGDFLTRVNFFEYLDDVAAQPTGAPGPMRIHRETFQAGNKQTQELDLIGEI
jgi:hypothetical protein